MSAETAANRRKVHDIELAALHDKSFGWALACCARDRDLACDVLQQAYWKVLSGRVKFEGRSSLTTWLFGVIRLTAMEQRRFTSLRWLRRTRASAEEANEVPADAPSPSESVADRQTAAALSLALGELAERQREILHLVFYEGLSIREGAEIMGVSVGTASQHYERGKVRLLEILTSKGVRFQ